MTRSLDSARGSRYSSAVLVNVSVAVLRLLPSSLPSLRLPARRCVCRSGVVSSGALLRARCVTRPAPGRPDELLLFRPICSRPARSNSSGAARPPAAGVGAAVLQ